MPPAPLTGPGPLRPARVRGSRLAALALALLMAAPGPGPAGPLRPVRNDGVNLIQDDAHPYGSAPARQAILDLAADGAQVVALVPFLWQPKPDSTDIVRGDDMRDDQLRAGIRTARKAGLKVMVKPHIWVPERWAGSVVMQTDADWAAWFERYRNAVVHLAGIAAEEGAEFFSIGTEVAQSTDRPEWAQVIAAVREVYPGRLTYSAHWAEEVERFPFWSRLDAVAVTLYPALGADDDPDAWRRGMAEEIDRVIAVANRVGRPVWITEIGLRSAEGAVEKPWESAEERVAVADGDLQSDVLAVWYQMLDRPEIEQILIWRWITDPRAGGRTDTDFTVQNKPAQKLLTCLWRGRCPPTSPRFSERLKTILAARAASPASPTALPAGQAQPGGQIAPPAGPPAPAGQMRPAGQATAPAERPVPPARTTTPPTAASPLATPVAPAASAPQTPPAPAATTPLPAAGVPAGPSPASQPSPAAPAPAPSSPPAPSPDAGVPAAPSPGPGPGGAPGTFDSPAPAGIPSGPATTAPAGG